MQVELTRTFAFSAAHALPCTGPDHKCRETHGHNFTVEITVRGRVEPETGWLLDFGDLRRIVDPVIARLDHHLLNEIPGLGNPTSEMLSRWIWDRLRPALPGLRRVTVCETPSSRCSYWGEE
jgi:6-pyruvoyltetrahydropterin/6-carboxytetrahydropterin synthase